MKATRTMPMDDEPEVEAFALGELWTAFTKAIETGRNNEILNERADNWVANPIQALNSTRPKL
jgi:hypothetical protein